MTLATSASAITYTGNNSTTVWSYSFIIPATSDVVVSLTTISTNNTVALDPSVYTITGINNANGGTVTYPLVGSPITTDQRISIQRIVPLVQNTDIVNQSAFYPDTLEAALDYLTMITQQIQEEISRAVIFPVGTTTDIPALIASILAGQANADAAAASATASAASATAAAASAAVAAAAYPIGSVISWDWPNLPAQHLYCYGQTLNYNDYPEVGTLAGSTPGGTFVMPDRRDRIDVGRGAMGGTDANRITNYATTLGAVGGEDVHPLITAELATHLHSVSITSQGISADHVHSYDVPGSKLGQVGGASGSGGAGNVWYNNSVGGGTTTVQSADHTHAVSGNTGNNGSGTAHNNVQPFITTNKIMFMGR